MDKVVRTLRTIGVGLAMMSSAAMFDGCVHRSSVSDQHVANEPAELQQPKRREGVDAVLILIPDTKSFHEVLVSLNDELVQDLDVFTHIITLETTVEEIDRKIQEIKPSCLVLMNNQTVKLYKEYQDSKPKQTQFPPSILVMTSYLGQIYKNIKGATGIAYEIPEVTVFVKLRTFLDRPISKVGVVYRTPFKNYLKDQALYAKREKIDTVAINVGQNPTPSDVKNAIQILKEKHNIDALWVLNDNVLLAGEKMIQSGWLKGLDDNEIPVVVGVENLVNKDIHFGAFAMVPDHGALGVQAANIVYEIYDNGWKLGKRNIEQPLSVKTIADIVLVRNKLQFREDMIGSIDILVE